MSENAEIRLADDANCPLDVDDPMTKVMCSGPLVQHILSFVAENTMQALNLRLVSKTFSNATLRQVRLEHREIRIDIVVGVAYYPGQHSWNRKMVDFLVPPPKDHMLVQKVPMVFRQFLGYCQFLMGVARVKADSVTGRGLEHVAPEDKKTVHDILLHFLEVHNRPPRRCVGLEQLCQAGCPRCTHFTTRCAEFGPIPINTYMTVFKKPHHYKMLVVNDYFLYALALRCVKASSSREECLRTMRELVTPMITCQRLHFVFGKTLFETDRQFRAPIELVYEMIRKWGVTEASVEVYDSCEHNRRAYPGESWGFSTFFNGFSLPLRYELVVHPTFKLDRLTVFKRKGAHEESIITDRDSGYDYIDVNIWRFLPASHFICHNENLVSTGYTREESAEYTMDTFLRNTGSALQHVFMENQRDTVVELYTVYHPQTMRLPLVGIIEYITNTFGLTMTTCATEPAAALDENRYIFRHAGANFELDLRLKPAARTIAKLFLNL